MSRGTLVPDRFSGRIKGVLAATDSANKLSSTAVRPLCPQEIAGADGKQLMYRDPAA